MAFQNERPMVEVFHDIVGDVQELIRSQFRLAVVEVREEARKAARAGRMLGAGIVLAFYVLGFLLLAAVYALELVVATWLAALIVAVVLAVVSGALVAAGRKQMKRVRMPEKTIETAKENAQWAKQQVT